MNHPASAPPRPDPAAIRRALAGRLDADARAWLDTALAEAAEGAGAGPLPAWERRFAEAGRRAAPPTPTPPASCCCTPQGPTPAPSPASTGRAAAPNAAPCSTR